MARRTSGSSTRGLVPAAIRWTFGWRCGSASPRSQVPKPNVCRALRVPWFVVFLHRRHSMTTAASLDIRSSIGNQIFRAAQIPGKP